jgi:hypothetical protein
MVGERAVEEVLRLKDYADTLKSRLELAMQVVKRHIDVFTSKELESLALAGVLHPLDIPEGKRTDAVKRFIQLMSVAKVA